MRADIATAPDPGRLAPSHPARAANRPAAGEGFTPEQIRTVAQATRMAEELVSEAYKMSARQWLRPRYDIRTAADLTAEERIEGPLAQIIRYTGQLRASPLGSAAFDFYKICLQDHAILERAGRLPQPALLPFTLYVMVHELVHIVRFGRFLQCFCASPAEIAAEEGRVHAQTGRILSPLRLGGLAEVLALFAGSRQPLEHLHTGG
jgi:hypothetical protein